MFPTRVPKHLLDTLADQNIGNGVIVRPQAGPATVIPQTNPDRILMLSGPSGAGQTTSVVLTVSRIVGDSNPDPGFPGPLTGVIEFGNGGRDTKIEIDLAVGPFAGTLDQASNAVEPQDGITIVTLPTGVLRVYARYDNQLLAPVLGYNGQTHAQLSGIPVNQIVGPGGPITLANPAPPPAPPTIVVPSEPVLVKAMAAYYAKARSKAYKTVNCYLSAAGALGTSIRVGTLANGQPMLTVGGYPGYAFYTLPSSTRSVKVLRFPDASAMSVLLHDGIRPVDYIQIPGGPTAPVINVIGNENIIGLTSGSDHIQMLKLVCEIGI